MPWKTLCGFPPTTDDVALLVPNGRWRPDTVITDVEGNEIFVVVEQSNEMRSYEVVLGDLDGRRLVCVKRHLMKAFWRDGFYFCTYRPNYPGQKALTDRDIDNKKVYPFSYLEIHPLKGIFNYRHFDAFEQLKPPRLTSQNPWFGFMTVCCTPLMRFGNFATRFRRMKSRATVIKIDQWSNTVKVGPGQDLLAALSIAYVFDRVQGQPLVTVVGRDEEEELEGDDVSIESDEEMMNQDKNRGVEMTNMPEYRDHQPLAVENGGGQYYDDDQQQQQQQYPLEGGEGYYDDGQANGDYQQQQQQYDDHHQEGPPYDDVGYDGQQQQQGQYDDNGEPIVDPYQQDPNQQQQPQHSHDGDQPELI